MPRFKKAGDKYEEDENGDYFKAGDGKLYKMEGGSQTRKSMDGVTEDDLQKSLDRLADMATEGDTRSRKRYHAPPVDRSLTREALRDGRRQS